MTHILPSALSPHSIYLWLLPSKLQWDQKSTGKDSRKQLVWRDTGPGWLQQSHTSHTLHLADSSKFHKMGLLELKLGELFVKSLRWQPSQASSQDPTMLSSRFTISELYHTIYPVWAHTSPLSSMLCTHVLQISQGDLRFPKSSQRSLLSLSQNLQTCPASWFTIRYKLTVANPRLINILNTGILIMTGIICIMLR